MPNGNITPEDMSTIKNRMEALSWYHTIDLGSGLSTPGIYNHYPYLPYYGLPKDLTGRSALDIGTASGFFAFELEKRGAEVMATELPTWLSHDFGPNYQHSGNLQEAENYLHDPFLFAQERLKSKVQRKLINIYDISPETVGSFDLVFCASVLLHITDPIKALWNIQSVTKEAAIIATVIHTGNNLEPLALYQGHQRGDVWWLPNRTAFEALVKSAGFQGWEWYSEFQLNYRDGKEGPYHAVIRAWNTQKRPAILETTDIPMGSLPGRRPGHLTRWLRSTRRIVVAQLRRSRK